MQGWSVVVAGMTWDTPSSGDDRAEMQRGFHSIPSPVIHSNILPLPAHQSTLLETL